MLQAALILLLIFATPAFGNNYSELHQAGIKRCEAIDGSEYQTGLLFNPDGMRSYYLRSQCFQRLAIELRDLKLCDRVKRRYSLFSSSWGYSKSVCQEKAEAAIASDRAQLEKKKAQYLASRISLESFVVKRNGNGRDIDINPTFSGSPAGSYRLSFSIVDPGSGRVVPIHSQGFYLDGEKSRISIFKRMSEIKASYPELLSGIEYQIEARLILNAGGANWNPDFVNSVFPVEERTQVLLGLGKF